MKKILHVIQNKTWSIVSLLASSVITSSISDAALSAKYITYRDGQNFITVSVSEYSKTTIILWILALVLTIWCFLGLLLPLLLHVASLLHYKKRLKYSRHDIMQVYTEAKRCIRDIYNLQTTAHTSNSNLLYAQDVFSSINELYRIFSVRRIGNRSSIDGIIRYGKSIDSINTHISAYDFSVFLDCAEAIIEQFRQSSTSSTLNSDCTVAITRINHMREFVRSMPD